MPTCGPVHRPAPWSPTAKLAFLLCWGLKDSVHVPLIHSLPIAHTPHGLLLPLTVTVPPPLTASCLLLPLPLELRSQATWLPPGHFCRMIQKANWILASRKAQYNLGQVPQLLWG